MLHDFHVTHDSHFFTNYVDTLLKGLAFTILMIYMATYLKFYKIGGINAMVVAVPITSFLLEMAWTGGILISYRLYNVVPIQIIGTYGAVLAIVYSAVQWFNHPSYLLQSPHVGFLLLAIEGLSSAPLMKKPSHALLVFENFLQVLTEYLIIPAAEGFAAGGLIGAIAWGICLELQVDLREILLDVDLWIQLYFVMPLVVFGGILQTVFFFGGSYDELSELLNK